MLNLFKEAVNVNDIGGGDRTIGFDGQCGMAREPAGGWADVDDFDAIGSEGIGHRETVGDFPGGNDRYIQTYLGL